ncbi:MAG: RidA family protein [Bacteroidales bacterium]|nr:RidA family protein [Bacteroidales bacterium]
MIHRLAYTPIPTLSFHEALSDCLHHLDTIQQKTPVLGVVFFVNADSLNTFLNQEATILKTMAAGERNLPSTILAQASESAIAMEVWADSQAENIEYVEFADRHYTRYTSGGGKALLALGLRTTPELSLQSQAEAVFQHVNNLLTQEGLGFTDIVRQWNYVPGILEMQSHGSKSLQHYQVFNEVRKDWYN